MSYIKMIRFDEIPFELENSGKYFSIFNRIEWMFFTLVRTESEDEDQKRNSRSRHFGDHI